MVERREGEGTWLGEHGWEEGGSAFLGDYAAEQDQVWHFLAVVGEKIFDKNSFS